MKLLKLTQNQYAQVDDDLYDELTKCKWYAHLQLSYRNGGAFTAETKYAWRHKPVKESTVSMHRFVYWLKTKDASLFKKHLSIDHIDGNPLNNQFSNLRLATEQQQTINQPLSTRNKTGLKGVCWVKTRKKWQVNIEIDGHSRQLGRFTCKLNAWLVYKEAHIYYFGCDPILARKYY